MLVPPTGDGDWEELEMRCHGIEKTQRAFGSILKRTVSARFFGRNASHTVLQAANERMWTGWQLRARLRALRAYGSRPSPRKRSRSVRDYPLERGARGGATG